MNPFVTRDRFSTKNEVIFLMNPFENTGAQLHAGDVPNCMKQNKQQ
jgi:hypothetical protein